MADMTDPVTLTARDGSDVTLTAEDGWLVITGDCAALGGAGEFAVAAAAEILRAETERKAQRWTARLAADLAAAGRTDRLNLPAATPVSTDPDERFNETCPPVPENEYGCVRCQAYHRESDGPVYAEHITWQSKHGIRRATPLINSVQERHPGDETGLIDETADEVESLLYAYRPRECTCPPDLRERGGFTSSCPVHGTGPAT